MRLRSIQALRAVAAILVIFDHFPRLEGKLFPNGMLHGFGAAGSIGVDLFFVISGFIMVSTTWNSFGRPDAANRFLARRFLRIYPAYWAALIPFVAIGLLLPSALYVAPVNVTSFITSLLLIPHEHGPLMFVAWSLEFEVYFYLIFAFALRFERTKLPLVFGLWLMAILALNVVSRFAGVDLLSFLGDPLPLEFMGGGVIGYLVLKKRIVAPMFALIAGVVLAAAVAIYSSRFDGFGTPELAWFRVLAAGPAMMLIVYGAASLEEQGRLVAPQFAVALGDVSYTMYLWHGMLLGAYDALIGRLHLHGRIADALYIVIGVAIVISGSLLIYRMIEAPLMGFAKRLFRISPNSHRVVVQTT